MPTKYPAEWKNANAYFSSVRQGGYVSKYSRKRAPSNSCSFIRINGDIYRMSRLTIGKGTYGRVKVVEDCHGKEYAIKIHEKLPVEYHCNEVRVGQEVGLILNHGLRDKKGNIRKKIKGGLYHYSLMHKHGHSLERLLKNSPGLSNGQRWNYAIDLALNVSLLHLGALSKNGIKIAHRDIKPSNVLVDGRKTTLCDYGLSEIGKVTLRPLYPDLGTPFYLPFVDNRYSRQQLDAFALMRTLFMPNYVHVRGHGRMRAPIGNSILTSRMVSDSGLSVYLHSDGRAPSIYNPLQLCCLLILAKVKLISEFKRQIDKEPQAQKAIIVQYYSGKFDKEAINALLSDANKIKIIARLYSLLHLIEKPLLSEIIINNDLRMIASEIAALTYDKKVNALCRLKELYQTGQLIHEPLDLNTIRTKCGLPIKFLLDLKALPKTFSAPTLPSHVVEERSKESSKLPTLDEVKPSINDRRVDSIEAMLARVDAKLQHLKRLPKAQGITHGQRDAYQRKPMVREDGVRPKPKFMKIHPLRHAPSVPVLPAQSKSKFKPLPKPNSGHTVNLDILKNAVQNARKEYQKENHIVLGHWDMPSHFVSESRRAFSDPGAKPACIIFMKRELRIEKLQSLQNIAIQLLKQFDENHTPAMSKLNEILLKKIAVAIGDIEGKRLPTGKALYKPQVMKWLREHSSTEAKHHLHI